MEGIGDTQAWKTLETLAAEVKQQHMRAWFETDTERNKRFSASACGMHLDFSKNLITDQVMDALYSLAQTRRVEQKVKAMFIGQTINTTENRAVLHTALRNFSGEPVMVDGEDVMPSVLATLDKMQTFTQAVLSGEHKGCTGKAIKKAVCIGIGGSFLGPKIVTEALKPYHNNIVEVIFVANVDACHIQDVLSKCDYQETLFVMSSKSFGTQETLQNTLSARKWFLNQGASEADIAKHFVAVSSNVNAATEFGMASDKVFPMADWVGGRYSLWSAIGLPICLALGYNNFKRILDGAFAMDEHVKTAPPSSNLPMILALLGVWYRNFMDAQSHVLLPYYHYLRGFPAYVQQLDMESNGKSTTLDGANIDHGTGPIIWGSEGTNGQHSFHQLIHQSNMIIPADFMFPIKVLDQDELHHAMLASNCFGQTQALMQGKTFEECYQDLADQNLTEDERTTLAAHKTMPGNKPSNTILFDQIDPKTLGSLIAMYEHKVLIQGAIWDVNSFDQWGVELGKALGNDVLEVIQNKKSDQHLDASTRALIKKFIQTNQ